MTPSGAQHGSTAPIARARLRLKPGEGTYRFTVRCLEGRPKDDPGRDGSLDPEYNGWNPRRDSVIRDDRELGVMLYSIEIEAINEDGNN